MALETASSLCWRTTSTSSFTPATSHRELLNLSRFGVFVQEQLLHYSNENDIKLLS